MSSGGKQVYLELPRRNGPQALSLTGEELRARLLREACIPIQEDYGCYANWLWFPGRSISATAHWWVNEAPPQLIGQVYRPADDEGHAIYAELEEDRALPWVFADGDWNTFMALPARFESNLIPLFARATADLDECRLVKRKRRGRKAHSLKTIRDDAQLLAHWRISESVAHASPPDEFLERLLRAMRQQISPLPRIHS